jgi:hypothetical protein
LTSTKDQDRLTKYPLESQLADFSPIRLAYLLAIYLEDFTCNYSNAGPLQYCNNLFESEINVKASTVKLLTEYYLNIQICFPPPFVNGIHHLIT